MKPAASSAAGVFLCLVAACSRPTQMEPAEKEEGPVVLKPGLVLLVAINKLVSAEGEETTQSFKTFQDPTLALIEEKFNVIAWNDPKLRPTVSMTRNDIGRSQSTLKISRPRDSGPTKSLRAEWIIFEKDEMLVSPTFESPDTGLALLKAYFSDEQKLNELAKWSKAE
jgi:hypothetical protein